MNESIGSKGEIILVFTDEVTGAKRVYRHKNSIAHAGSRYYAQLAAGETPTEFVDGSDNPDHAMVLWESATFGTVSNPFSNIDLQDNGTDDSWDAAAPYTTSSKKSLDSGYPQLDDPDPDNAGAGPLVLTYRFTLGTSDAVSTAIRGAALVDQTFSLSSWSSGMLFFSAAWVAGGSAITKTGSESLKVYFNHFINIA